MITKTDVGLCQLLYAIKERWVARMNERSNSLLIIISDNVIVHADHGFLEIMLENLISNAVKYGHDGQQIVCSWNSEEKKISITDNGPGIPQEHLPFLFNRFYRTDASRNSQIQGNGLGLSIVRMLADLQQITISVNSEPGQGTTFTLHFNS
jgi:signal transduction histidine kinase